MVPTGARRARSGPDATPQRTQLTSLQRAIHRLTPSNPRCRPARARDRRALEPDPGRIPREPARRRPQPRARSTQTGPRRPARGRHHLDAQPPEHLDPAQRPTRVDTHALRTLGSRHVMRAAASLILARFTTADQLETREACTAR